MIAVMQAYADGKEIQYRRIGNGEWDDCKPRWDWAACEYRVKPEPREWWILTTTRGGAYAVCASEIMAAEGMLHPGQAIVHVREVLE
jgi:hypothetical protein